LFNTLNFQAIFLHSPDKEFASVGAKSNIPYEKWFGQFKGYLMANAHKEQIKELYMWWNGWVFSFEKARKLTNIDDEESSGMDEAVECLDDFDMQVSTNQQERGWQDLEEDLIETFDSLAMAEHQELASSSGSGVPQPASVSTFSPGPSYTHSVEQQDIMPVVSDVLQPIEEEVRSQNGKGKEKAVDITEADVQVKKAVARGKQRGRPKKTAI
jgi:hypothetical protein